MHVKPRLLRAANGKLAFLATSLISVSFAWFCFKMVSPNENLWYLPLVCGCSPSQDQAINGNGGVWRGQSLQEASHCASLGSPKDCSAIATKVAAQQATASVSDTEKAHLVPSAPYFPSLGNGKTITFHHAQQSLDGPQTHHLEPKGTEFKKKNKTDPTPTLESPQLSLLANEAQCKRKHKLGSRPPPSHHVILTGDFLLAHRRDT